jgi:hypothetical protein
MKLIVLGCILFVCVLCQAQPQFPLDTWVNGTVTASTLNYNITVPNDHTSIQFRIIAPTGVYEKVSILLKPAGGYGTLYTLGSRGLNYPVVGYTCPGEINQGNYLLQFSCQNTNSFTAHASLKDSDLPAEGTLSRYWTSSCSSVSTAKSEAGVVIKFDNQQTTGAVKFFIYLTNTTDDSNDIYQPYGSNQLLTVYLSKGECVDVSSSVYQAAIPMQSNSLVVEINNTSVPPLSTGTFYLLITVSAGDVQCNLKRNFYMGYCYGDNCNIPNPDAHGSTDASTSTGMSTGSITTGMSAGSITTGVSTDSNTIAMSTGSITTDMSTGSITTAMPTDTTATTSTHEGASSNNPSLGIFKAYWLDCVMAFIVITISNLLQ